MWTRRSRGDRPEFRPSDRLVFAAGLLACVATSSCILFTDEFNTPPQVKISGPNDLYRGQPAEFIAEVVDGSQGELRIDWSIADDCPRSLEEALQPRPGSFLATGPKSTFPRDRGAPGCLFVLVTDSAGARGFGTKAVTVKTRALAIERPPMVVGSQAATFTATFADDAGAVSRSAFAWAQATDTAEGMPASTCETALVRARSETPEKANVSWKATAPHRRYCVAVIARDEFGTITEATLRIDDLVILGPPAKIRIVQPTTPAPFGLYTEIRLAPADDEELVGGEARVADWQVNVPGGGAIKPKTCTGSKTHEACFAVEAAGDHTVTLAVSENGQTTTATPLTFTVADQAPCIRETKPGLGNPPRVFGYYDQDQVFSVLQIEDDADPIPFGPRAGQGQFIWSIRAEGATSFVSYVGNFRELTIAARRFGLGDRIEVRVQYLDRLDLSMPKARNFEHCQPGDTFCELVPKSGCYHWITWTVDL